MPLIGVFKLSSILIKLLYSSKYLFYILIKCEKSIIQDQKTLELRFLRIFKLSSRLIKIL